MQLYSPQAGLDLDGETRPHNHEHRREAAAANAYSSSGSDVELDRASSKYIAQGCSSSSSSSSSPSRRHGREREPKPHAYSRHTAHSHHTALEDSDSDHARNSESDRVPFKYVQGRSPGSPGSSRSSGRRRGARLKGSPPYSSRSHQHRAPEDSIHDHARNWPEGAAHSPGSPERVPPHTDYSGSPHVPEWVGGMPGHPRPAHPAHTVHGQCIF